MGRVYYGKDKEYHLKHHQEGDVEMNKVIILGRLTSDVELKQAGEFQIANFSVATNKKIKGVDKASFHNVVAWNKQAEVLSKYSAKGKRVLIEGEISYETYEKDGQTKYITKIVAHNVQIVDFVESNKTTFDAKKETTISVDEIPF